MMLSDVTDLPDPDSPTIDSTSPRRMSKLIPLTALTRPAFGGERRAQVAHRQQHLGILRRSQRRQLALDGVGHDLVVVSVWAADERRRPLLRRQLLISAQSLIAASSGRGCRAVRRRRGRTRAR